MPIREGESTPTEDPIRPKHYTELQPEPISVIEGWQLGFNLGNCVKYISRAGRKSADPVEDLRKAAWYLEREIEQQEGRLDYTGI